MIQQTYQYLKTPLWQNLCPPNLEYNPDTFLNPKQYFYSEGLHEIFDYVDHETTEFRSRRLDVIL